ncbi:aspartate aminotransferase family protein [Haliangium sp.]|uniref:aspartate aminotransferase family protein n=1 Tax=Haliangium sp. TaxID=2663208 RepID=UPI003D0CC05D
MASTTHEPGDKRTRAAPRHPIADAYARHVNPAFVELLGLLGYGRVWARARGCTVWDHDGNAYFDCLAGFGSVNLGHNHPRLIERLRALLDQDAFHLCHLGPSAPVTHLAEALAARLPAPLELCLFASGGAEAVEAGLKLARAATGRRRFLYCTGGFHGTSLGTLSIMGAARLRRPFEPLLGDCRALPFGDLGALERALRAGDVAAFVVEPIQAEGGVVVPPPGYLAAAQELCRRHGAVLVLDEIQTGLGRCGRWFGFEHEGFVPDVLVLAKALSGGVAPISCAVVSRALHQRAYGRVDRFDLHSSTFEGNALGCTAALATLHILAEDDLVANAAARGEQLLAGLQRRLAGHPFVVDIRGRGLLVGIELGPTRAGLLNRVAPALVGKLSEQVFGQWAAVRLLERGIVCQPASHRWNVLRLEPPLICDPDQIDHVIDAVAGLLDEYRRLPRLIKDVAARLGTQWRAGWGF